MKTVLIIESDTAIRVRLEEDLRRDGYEVVGAAHGAAGLAAAREYFPDLVLCAERMPGMDGCHVARLLRQDAEIGRPPFLLMGGGERPAFVQGPGIGVDGYLRVPPTPEALRAAVREWMREDEDERLAPPVPRIPLAGQARVASDILADLAGATGELLDVVEKFFRFTQVRQVLERRRAEAKAPGPRPMVRRVHSNQVGSLAQVAADARGRSADLNSHLEKGFLPLEMEELSLMIGELVENACRFSVAGAPIDVFYFRQGEGSEVMVRDYGVGMTPSEVEAIRAGAGDISRVREGGPSGERLGLTMVRMIAESRGGRLLIHSIPAVGTTVRVLIPDASPTDRAAGPGQAGRADLGVPPFEEGGGEPF